MNPNLKKPSKFTQYFYAELVHKTKKTAEEKAYLKGIAQLGKNMSNAEENEEKFILELTIKAWKERPALMEKELRAAEKELQAFKAGGAELFMNPHQIAEEIEDLQEELKLFVKAKKAAGK